MLCHAVSHDLRAPLRAVDGFTRMLMQRCEGRLQPEETRLLNIVRTNSATMNRLIDDIVDFARLSRDGLRVVDVDMAALVSEAWADAGSGFAGHLQVQGLSTARGDRSLLTQVWTHLLANAVKFSAPVSAPVITVSGERHGDEQVYTVRDNGVGFDMTYADKLFKAFQRLHGATEFPGNGIGLASVARIVKRHGGSVGAEGHPGHGATFWFALPTSGVFE
jgi:light-regulated signal transduction histidine kinase (bacteriophytochrome)